MMCHRQSEYLFRLKSIVSNKACQIWRENHSGITVWSPYLAWAKLCIQSPVLQQNKTNRYTSKLRLFEERNRKGSQRHGAWSSPGWAAEHFMWLQLRNWGRLSVDSRMYLQGPVPIFVCYLSYSEKFNSPSLVSLASKIETILIAVPMGF
jgi:hypothetical protein